MVSTQENNFKIGVLVDIIFTICLVLYVSITILTHCNFSNLMIFFLFQVNGQTISKILRKIGNIYAKDANLYGKIHLTSLYVV